MTALTTKASNKMGSKLTIPFQERSALSLFESDSSGMMSLCLTTSSGMAMEVNDLDGRPREEGASLGKESRFLEGGAQ